MSTNFIFISFFCTFLLPFHFLLQYLNYLATNVESVTKINEIINLLQKVESGLNFPPILYLFPGDYLKPGRPLEPNLIIHQVRNKFEPPLSQQSASYN